MGVGEKEESAAQLAGRPRWALMLRPAPPIRPSVLIWEMVTASLACSHENKSLVLGGCWVNAVRVQGEGCERTRHAEVL